MTKQIPVTHGNETLYALVDDEDYDGLIHLIWHSHRGTDEILYARASLPTGKRRVKGDPSPVYMHKLILHNAEEVDHVNRDGLDNRKENLRAATRSLNNANQRPRRNKVSSKYKGVTLLATSDGNENWKRKKPWVSRVRYQGKTYRLGYFETEEEAARAYDLKARELFGEFARLNFPDDERKNE